MRYNYVEVSDLIGKTLTRVYDTGNNLVFITNNDERYEMFHQQDCCESVTLDDVCGDLEDLVGSPILVAEEVNGETPADFDGEDYGKYGGSYTWTFYKFATRKGYVDLRWFGTSNGYYSEGVDFVKYER